MTCSVIAAMGSREAVPTKALSFTAASSQSLTMSSANWGGGVYHPDKWSIAGSLKMASNITTGRYALLARQFDNSTREFSLQLSGAVGGSKLTIATYDTSGASIGVFQATTQFTAGAYHSFLIQYDKANATSGNRIKMWIDNAAETASIYTAPTTSMVNKSVSTSVGASTNSGDFGYYDGLLYSLTFFDNVLPTAAQVFRGGSGGLHDLSKISGAYSILDVAGGVVTHDGKLATAWTNNNTVVASSTIPT